MKLLTLSPDQQAVLEKLLFWYKNQDYEPDNPIIKQDNPPAVITVGGYAGTGKTTILAHLRHELGDEARVGFVSLTGKAVAVMRSKISHISKGQDTISTLHSFMYYPDLDDFGNIREWVWKPMAECVKDLDDITLAPMADLFINDEASMTSQELYDDMLRYDRPIIAVGDHGQLPPVTGNLNLMKSPAIRLEKIHRQAADNPILHLATMAREGTKIDWDTYGPGVEKVTMHKAKEHDRINYLLENPGPETVILTCRHDTRIHINQVIRERLGFDPDTPEVGDRIICLRNDNKLGIYNGQIGYIEGLWPDEDHPHINYYAKIKLEDSERVIKTPITKHTFNARPEKENTDNRWQNYGSQWDYGYCLTTHKAQGSEFDNVVVYGNAWPAIQDKWLYTAITRAKNELYLVA